MSYTLELGGLGLEHRFLVKFHKPFVAAVIVTPRL